MFHSRNFEVHNLFLIPLQQHQLASPPNSWVQSREQLQIYRTNYWNWPGRKSSTRICNILLRNPSRQSLGCWLVCVCSPLVSVLTSWQAVHDGALWFPPWRKPVFMLTMDLMTSSMLILFLLIRFFLFSQPATWYYRSRSRMIYIASISIIKVAHLNQFCRFFPPP